MMLPVGESERLLIKREVKRLAEQAWTLTVAAREVPADWADLTFDMGGACAEQAKRLREQLERTRRRPPRTGRPR